jgi:hypothetical protein
VDTDTAVDTGTDTGTEPPAVPAWSFLVWMDGDNDLETYVLHDINELEEGMPSEDVQVFALVDRVEGYDDSDGDWTGTRLYRIVGDDDPDVVKSEVVAELGEWDMGDPSALAAFLLQMHADWPAERYALSLWNHGSGWYADDGERPPGIAWDETSESEIGIADGELVAALEPLVAQRGPIDVLAFDACNMAGFEVAHVLRNHARTLVAAPSWVGGEGLQYASAVAALSADPDTDTEAFADLMARDTVDIGHELSYAAIRLDGIDALAESLDTLAGLAVADADARSQLVAAREATRAVETGTWKNTYVDIGELGALTSGQAHEGLAQEGGALVTALEGAVIGAYGSYRLDWNNGMTVFFDTYDLDHYTQDGATWAQATRWDDLLLLLDDEASSR